MIVAALTQEPRSEEMQHWLSMHENGQLLISDWTATEVASALSMKVRSAQLDWQMRWIARAKFEELCSESFTLVAVDPRDFSTATMLLDRENNRLRSGDALHLAVAMAHDATLCTLDGRFAEEASAVGAPHNFV